MSGRPAEGLRWRHVADDDWSADAMLTQCCGPAPVDLVHQSTVDRIKGVRHLLIWTVCANRTDLVARGRGRRGCGRPAVAPCGARRRGSPAMARSAIRAPNRAEITPGGRGEDEEAHQGFGGEGRAPSE
jgi:hypothetical protein